MGNRKQEFGDDPLKLENQLCFLLYSASRKMTAAYRPLLGELGITYPQYLVMMVLWEFYDVSGEGGQKTIKIPHEKQGINVGQLSARLQLDSGTLTPLLKRLEQQGLVDRVRDRSDERVVRVYLTEAGVCLRRKALKVPEALRCASGLTIEQLGEVYEQLRSTLGKLSGSSG